MVLSLRDLPYGIDRIDDLEGMVSNRLIGMPMHEVKANQRVRELCQQILGENDPDRVEELIATLRNTLRSENEEARLRMDYVARRYRGQLQSISLEAERLNQGVGRMRALLDFLGLGAGMKLGRELEG